MLRPVSTRFKHSVHTYQGVSPWSRDGRRLLYAAWDSAEAVHLVVQDLAAAQEQIIAPCHFGNYHVAAWQHWALDDRAVVFCDAADDDGGHITIVHLGQDKVRRLESPRVRELRHVAADGIHAYCTAHNDDPAAIYRVDLRSGHTQVLLTAERAQAAVQSEYHDPHHRYSFSHPVANRDQTLLFTTFLRQTRPWPPHPNGMPNWGAFLVLDLVSGEIRCFGNRISGHPAWTADARQIINIKHPLDGSDNRWLVQVDSRTGEDRRLLDRPIQGAGHPVYSPDGRWVATDAYPPDHQHCVIQLFDPTSGRLSEIARLPHCIRAMRNYEPANIFRAHGHPAWSPDGRQLAVNCNQSGTRMQLMVLDAVLPK